MLHGKVQVRGKVGKEKEEKKNTKMGHEARADESLFWPNRVELKATGMSVFSDCWPLFFLGLDLQNLVTSAALLFINCQSCGNVQWAAALC